MERVTRHASLRSQQRGIPRILVDLLIDFGAQADAGYGARKLFFDKQARRRIHAYAGPLASLLDEHLDVYAVVGADMQVITVGHRTERIRRH